MNSTATTRIVQFFALPVVSAGIIGAAPVVKAHPAPSAIPGTHGHSRTVHVMNLEPSYRP